MTQHNPENPGPSDQAETLGLYQDMPVRLTINEQGADGQWWRVGQPIDGTVNHVHTGPDGWWFQFMPGAPLKSTYDSICPYQIDPWRLEPFEHHLSSGEQVTLRFDVSPRAPSSQKPSGTN